MKLLYCGMKPKFILTAFTLLTVSILTISCKHKANINDEAVKQFLTKFNGAVSSGNVDFIKTYFVEQDKKINRLAKILAGKTGATGQSPTHFRLDLIVDESKISPSSNGTIIDVSVPVLFSHNNIESANSVIVFKLILDKDRNMRISAINVSKFLPDYIAYENLVKSKTLTDNDIYAPITLKAFETAKQLKAKYDSVIWFEHINKQTYYYVTSGKWNIDELDIQRVHPDTAITYKMGLIGPDLKEIIPVDYDLIHNINGTINGLIEVERGHKHGFYNLHGKIIVPTEYDQIYPVTNDNALAALQKGDDFYWLNKDSTISAKVNISISEVLSQTSHLGNSNMDGSSTYNVTEFNSREQHGSVYIPPAYLVDLGIFSTIEQFKNPLRKNIDFEDVSAKINVKLTNKADVQKDGNVFETAFYSIRNYFLGGRSEFYDTNNLVIVDKRSNRIYRKEIITDLGMDEGGEEMTGLCNEYYLRPLNDTLLEMKITSAISILLYNGDYLDEAPVFHYLTLKDGKITEVETTRKFSFTKFRKMDDSYLEGCYLYLIKPSIGRGEYKKEQSNYLRKDVLQYMKNEIFADYHYKFKDSVWNQVFEESSTKYEAKNESVDDSLTEIDKYNINWINQKLKATESKKLASR
jgi:hypothetical protein